MAAFDRIIKNLGAALTGRLLTILPQVVLPPIFVHRYGIAGFGQWGVLSGAVGALGVLNFGVQTFVSQDLAVRWNRGEVAGYQVRQSTALRLLGGIVGTAAIVGLVLFLLPVESWLRLDIGWRAAQATAYLLGLQVLLNILLGFLTGIYLGVQRAHRGAYWSNFNSLLTAILLIGGVAARLPFPVLAATQVAGLLASMAVVLIDLKRTAPAIFPSVRFWNGSVAREMLKPSAYFGLISASTFLTYQLPLVILQRALGPVAVAAFLVMRTLFSMCRQLLAIFTQSLSTEITTLFGRRDEEGLARLYLYSEQLIFFLIPLINTCVLMLSPVLVTVWMHRRAELFSPYPYVLTAAISMVVSLKEHKYQFQASTNTHEDLAKIMFCGYVAMVFVSLGAVPVGGVVGFLWVWLATELLQMAAITRLNQKLFAGVARLEFSSLRRLAGICLGGLILAGAGLPRSASLSLLPQIALALGSGLAIAFAGGRLFHIQNVVERMRFRARSAPSR